MGNNGHEGYGGPDEFPQHWVDLPAFQIGKYEVTRGEYRKFIEAGGYDDPRYWSPEGWKWKESDVIDYSGMNGKVDHTVRPNAKEKRTEHRALGRRAGVDRARVWPSSFHPDKQASRRRRDLLRSRSVLQMGGRAVANGSGMGEGGEVGRKASAVTDLAVGRFMGR